MAEVLGVLASGIAIAQIVEQITKCIFKIKGYWNQIERAPTEINHLLREIESLNLILQHMQDDRSSQSLQQLSAHDFCLQKSLELCKECSKELSELVNQLAVKVQGKKGWKRKVGSAKIVLNKEDIKALKRSLKTSMSLLSLSYQYHTSAMIQLQPELIMMRLANHLKLTGIPETKSAEDHWPYINIPGPRQSNIVTAQYDVWMSSAPWIRFLFGRFEYRHRQCTRGRNGMKLYIQNIGYRQ